MSVGVHGHTATARLVADSGALNSHVVLVESRHVGLPTGIRSFTLPDGRKTPTDLPAVIIRLTDDHGCQGFSLLWFQRPGQGQLVEAAMHALAPEVCGHTLSDLVGIDGVVAAATAFLGRSGVNAFAVSGLRMALEDLICRRRGLSMADVLGRRRSRVSAYQTGLMLHATIDELIEEAAGIRARGLRALKMIIGKPSIDEDVERIQAVRESLGPDVTLMVDALQRWTSGEQALRAAERLAQCGLHWIEDPLTHDDGAGYHFLAQRSPIPIATGEAAFTQCEFDALVGNGIGYIVGEPERVGGLCAWMDVADTVHQSGAAMLPHLYPHVSAQLVAALPQDEVWMEYVPWFDALAVEQLTVNDDGTLDVTSSPGSGFTPDGDAIEDLAFGSWRRLNG
jgi:L-alanine-DL-glutamate epimerase-like enolase superfamily enzyme